MEKNLLIIPDFFRLNLTQITLALLGVSSP